MPARLSSFLIWGLVAASAVFWAGRFFGRPAPVPSQAAIVGPAPLPSVGLAPLFGAPAAVEVAAPPPVLADARFKLIGVAAAGAGQRSGLALIAVDDKPARAVPVGGYVDGALVVLSISHRQVDLGPAGGAATTSLTLPAVPEASRGVPQGMAPTAPLGLFGIPSAGVIGNPPAGAIGAPPARAIGAPPAAAIGTPPVGATVTLPRPPMPGRPFGATPPQLMAPQQNEASAEPQSMQQQR